MADTLRMDSFKLVNLADSYLFGPKVNLLKIAYQFGIIVKIGNFFEVLKIFEKTREID